MPRLPPDATPLVAFALGYGIDFGAHLYCGVGVVAALAPSLGGALAGLSAAGGHEALIVNHKATWAIK